MSLCQQKMDTPIGDLFLVASETGLRGVYWSKRAVPMGESAVLTKASQQLDEYFKGRRKTFDLPLNVAGTPFQEKVWRQLSQIPYGKTLSYKDLAARIENRKAVRAVGTANGRNPLSIIVPCHRVVAADGTLGGYSGGLGIKSQLLALERG